MFCDALGHQQVRTLLSYLSCGATPPKVDAVAGLVCVVAAALLAQLPPVATTVATLE